MNRDYKELKRNTLIIAAASMGSKIISFILAPLYSYYMSVADYGTMDLINSTIGLVLPFVCLDVYEAAYRYSNDSNYNKRRVLSSSIAISIPGIAVCILIPVFLQNINYSSKYIIIIAACIILGAVNYVMAQFLRGSSKMVLFALSGIVSSFALLLSNFFLLIVLNKALYGWLQSFLISKIVETIYLCLACNILGNFSVRAIDKTYIHEFIKYCLPLLPTAAMWWIMNLSDRYMLTFYLGAAATGIYSAANKLPSLLSILENIFYQAWQTTAINTLNNKDRDIFYSNVFNNYLAMMAAGVLGILIISKPMILILFSEDYSSAWIYIPLLILSVMVHALNGNLGALYSVFKNTKGALYSTFLGAAANIILNILFIPVIGIIGAALTTLIGYIITLLYRWFDSKKFVHINLNREDLIIYVVLISIQLILYYNNSILSYIVRCIIMLVLLVNKREIFYKIIKNR